MQLRLIILFLDFIFNILTEARQVTPVTAAELVSKITMYSVIKAAMCSATFWWAKQIDLF